MKSDSLDELQTAFADWRKTKKHRREAIPERLLARAQRCTVKHGVRAVVHATGVERARLFRGKTVDEPAKAVQAESTSAGSRPGPAFSRLQLGAPSVRPGPVAEVETDSGAKLRLYELTPEVIGLLGALCGVGGTR